MAGYLAGDESISQCLESPGMVSICSSENRADNLHAAEMMVNIENAVGAGSQAVSINADGAMETAVADKTKPHTGFNAAAAGVAGGAGMAGPDTGPAPEMTVAQQADMNAPRNG